MKKPLLPLMLEDMLGRLCKCLVSPRLQYPFQGRTGLFAAHRSSVRPSTACHAMPARSPMLLCFCGGVLAYGVVVVLWESEWEEDIGEVVALPTYGLYCRMHQAGGGSGAHSEGKHACWCKTRDEML